MPRSAISSASLNRCASGESNESSTVQFYGRRYGEPRTTAGWRLLDLLAAGGAEFCYHGDFDWGGIRIAAAVRDRVTQRKARWQPWRYDQDAYDAVALTTRTARMPRLAGDPVPTPWDPALAAAMTRRALRVEEELTLDSLLSDIR